MSEYYLEHSGRSKRDGAKIGSGRYPLGSGDRPYQATGGIPKSKNSRRRPDLSRLSDEELAKAIKREGLEEAYAKSFNLKYPDPVKTSNDVANAVKQGIEGAKKLEKSTRPKKKPLDLSKMSDEDLRKRINRVNLERQYNDMFNNDEQYISEGRARTIKVLDAAGDAAAVVSGVVIPAVTLAVLIKQLVK